MATLFVLDPVENRILPRRGRVLHVHNGMIVIEESGRRYSIPTDRILRIEWAEGEEIVV